ncbi:MAG: zinc-dependent alcohol dehydrogenase family protein [Fimbriiglobus sp.]
MNAVVFDRPGSPGDVLSVREVNVPVPGRGEVLVRMLASPVNPSDLLYIEGNYGLKPTYPATPGFEGVGVVEKSGGGLLGMLRTGKRVVVLGSRTGAWAEYCVASAKQVVPVPADLPDDQAAGFFVNPATALVITSQVLAVPPGAWLLQTAAGSALGKMVIRLGVKRGFRTLNVVRRREQADELRKLGATEVIVEADGPVPEQVKRLTNGAGVRYAMDPVGGFTGTGAVESLADGGTAVLYGLLSGEPVAVDPRYLITGSKIVRGFWLADWAKTASIPAKLRVIRGVKRLFAEGVFRTDVGTTLPLSAVADAVRQAAAPGKPGKVLLRIGGRGEPPA